MTRRTYKCECGTIEILQSMKDPPLNTCPKCLQEYRQIYHSPTFVNLIGFKEISRRNALEILEKGY